jgi:hypothetical protein
MIRAVILTALLALAACGGHTMAECKGPLFPLNATQWQPTQADLTPTPEDMKHE